MYYILSDVGMIEDNKIIEINLQTSRANIDLILFSTLRFNTGVHK